MACLCIVTNWKKHKSPPLWKVKIWDLMVVEKISLIDNLTDSNSKLSHILDKWLCLIFLLGMTKMS